MDIDAERAYPTPFANATLFPYLLMSLMSQRHSPKTKTTFRKEYDYVIVGAGSAGSTLAARLSEIPCVSVLLLEAGGPPPLISDIPAIERALWFSNIDWKYRTTPQRNTGQSLINRQVIWPSGKTLGGSSVLNSMFAVRGNRQDYDKWEELGARGWSYDDVLPYFKKMEDNRNPEYVANGYHGVGGPQTLEKGVYYSEMKGAIFDYARQQGIRVGDINGPSQIGYYDVQGTIRNGQRCSTAKAYLVPAENRTNLDIVSDAFVTKVLIENNQAIGVQFDFQENRHQVRAKREVILSAGTVNTAQILMLSGVGPREELERFQIPVIADLPVGKNLQEHCGVPLIYLLSPNIQPITQKLLENRTILRYITEKTGVLSAPTLTVALPFLNSYPGNGDSHLPDVQLYFGEINYETTVDFGLRPEIMEQYYGPLRNRAALACLSHVLQPRSRGTVTLQSSNPYDPPLIDPNYLDDPFDLQEVVNGLKECSRIFNSRPLKSIGSTPLPPFPNCEQYYGNDDPYFLCLARQFVITFNHQVSTAKMGDPSDPTTVVDPQLRVKYVKNLRVVDASVMPLIPSGNTNLPTIMVAEKAADIIKSTCTCGIDGTPISLQLDVQDYTSWQSKVASDVGSFASLWTK